MIKNLVSLVIPVYNQEQYLNSTIPTFLNQTYSEIELILVDDGSTDSSPDILNDFKAADSRIIIVSKQNGGLVDATISGIKHANGEYVCFVDPDDKIGPDFVETLMNGMTPDIDFVAAGIIYDNSNHYTYFPLKENKTFSNKDIQELKRTYLLSDDTINVSNRIYISRCNKIYRTSLLYSFVGEFTKCRNISLGEDSIFTYLMLSNAKGGKAIQDPNSYYYNVGNQNSMMKAGVADNYIRKCCDTFNTYKAILEKNKEPLDQAYALYYFLISNLLNRLMASNKKEYIRIDSKLRKDAIYQKAVNILKKHKCKKTERIRLYAKTNKISPILYFAYDAIVRTIKSISF